MVELAACGVEMLLAEAEGFARGGDYLGAQARARYANHELPDGAIAELRGHLDLRLQYYDRLARDWQQANVARHTAYVTRERRAIGADVAEAIAPSTRRTSIAFRRLWAAVFGCWGGVATVGGTP